MATIQQRKTLASPSRRRARPHLEPLESRELLSVAVIEGFESGVLNDYRSLMHNLPAAVVHTAAAHERAPGLGLLKQDSTDWVAVNDLAHRVQRGQVVSAWAQFADAADGRLYFGIGAALPTATQGSGPFRAYALVLAANTSQLLLQNVSGTSHTIITGASAAQTYEAGRWYRLEIEWGTSGLLTGTLYDSDGVTQLNRVSGTNTTLTTGGLAFRGFGGNKHFDTVVLDDDGTGSVADRAGAGGGLTTEWEPGVAPPRRANLPADQPSPVPWQYASAVGTGRDIQLDSYNGMSQLARVGTTVALAGANVSRNVGTLTQDWGPAFGGPSTPLLTQYLFRQRPGEATRLIGVPADAKHFFAPSTVTPGATDPYGSGLNGTQSLMTPGAEIDPLRGVLHRASHMGGVTNDGFDMGTGHSHPDLLEHRLNVPIADLDPAQNPEGTRWFMMGHIFVEADQNIANNSRWVEIRPVYNPGPMSFTFTYPAGSGGSINFRNIPGLVEPMNLGVRVIDDRDLGFSAAGNWIPVDASGYGYRDGVYALEAGTADDVASWSFTGLRPGRYRVSVTYPVDSYVVQTYTVWTGGASLATVPINPAVAPADFRNQGVAWKDLGVGLYAVTDGILTVTLAGRASGWVVADAVRIERVGVDASAILDDRDAGGVYLAGAWYDYAAAGYGYKDGVHLSDPAFGPSTAVCGFTGLAAGTYRVALAYPPDAFWSPTARITIWDGATALTTIVIDQQTAPGDFFDSGVWWRDLGATFAISSGTLVVEISDDLGVSSVVFDAVRIERV